VPRLDLEPLADERLEPGRRTMEGIAFGHLGERSAVECLPRGLSFLESEPTRGTVLAVFTVSLSRASPQTITFAYAAVSDTATVGLDLNPASGPVTFSPGLVSSQLGITVTSDGSSNLPEPDETYFVTLSNLATVKPLKPQGVGTILEP